MRLSEQSCALPLADNGFNSSNITANAAKLRRIGELLGAVLHTHVEVGLKKFVKFFAQIFHRLGSKFCVIHSLISVKKEAWLV